MERVSVDDLGSDRPRSGVERRGLSGPLGTADVAVNHLRVPPGERLPGGLHADQEELFYVVAGEAIFEFMGARSEARRTSGEITVRADEAVRFAPSEFKSGRNDCGEILVVLAVGAPRDSEDVRLPVDCPACGHDEMRMDTREEVELVCPACDTGRVPAPCPDCGEDDLRVTLDDRTGAERGDDETVVVCSGCGATFDSAPFRA